MRAVVAYGEIPAAAQNPAFGPGRTRETGDCISACTEIAWFCGGVNSKETLTAFHNGDRVSRSRFGARRFTSRCASLYMISKCQSILHQPIPLSGCIDMDQTTPTKDASLAWSTSSTISRAGFLYPHLRSTMLSRHLLDASNRVRRKRHKLELTTVPLRGYLEMLVSSMDDYCAEAHESA